MTAPARQPGAMSRFASLYWEEMKSARAHGRAEGKAEGYLRGYVAGARYGMFVGLGWASVGAALAIGFALGLGWLRWAA